MYIPPKYNSQYGIPIILEFGSLNTRVGFAGKDRPDAVVPSVNIIIHSVCCSRSEQYLKIINGILLP